MKIGIIGAGNVGSGLARLLTGRDHAVMLSFSKDEERLRASAQAAGAQAGTVGQAVAFADVVVLCTPFAATAEALAQAGRVEGGPKPLWDCTNALNADMSGLAIGTTTSAAEEVQRLAPWARVVKAIPPFADVLQSGDLRIAGQPVGVFVCGDDAPAKQAVSRLVADIGASPTDAGGLANARFVEPAAFLLVRLAYGQGKGSRIGLSLIEA